MDRGGEFKAEVQAALKDEYGITVKRITTRNPQSNSIIERIHEVVGDVIHVQNIRDKNDLDEDFGWTGFLGTVRQGARSLVHTTTRATPTQLVFGRDALLNVSFQADWDYIKERKQHRILQAKQQKGECQMHPSHLQRTRRPSHGQRRSTLQARRSSVQWTIHGKPGL
jgi:hypothetical protein